MAIEIDYELLPEDVIAFNYYASGHFPNGRVRPLTRSWVWIVLLIFGGLVLVGTMTLNPQKLEEMALSLFVLIILGSVIACLMFRGTLIGWYVRHELRKPGGTRWLGHHQITIARKGLTEVSPLAVTTINWDGILSIIGTPDHILFYIAPVQALVVPRRAFADAARFREFLELAQDYHEGIVEDEPLDGREVDVTFRPRDDDFRFKT